MCSTSGNNFKSKSYGHTISSKHFTVIEKLLAVKSFKAFIGPGIIFKYTKADLGMIFKA